MSASDLPVAALVRQFWPRRELRLKQHQIQPARLALFEAAHAQLLLVKGSYDPLYDARFQWFAAWLDLCEGTIPKIDPDLIARVEFFINGLPELSGRDRAAGAQLETLAQG